MTVLDIVHMPTTPADALKRARAVHTNGSYNAKVAVHHAKVLLEGMRSMRHVIDDRAWQDIKAAIEGSLVRLGHVVEDDES